jgi:hypothetical protein
VVCPLPADATPTHIVSAAGATAIGTSTSTAIDGTSDNTAAGSGACTTVQVFALLWIERGNQIYVHLRGVVQVSVVSKVAFATAACPLGVVSAPWGHKPLQEGLRI